MLHWSSQCSVSNARLYLECKTQPRCFYAEPWLRSRKLVSCVRASYQFGWEYSRKVRLEYNVTSNNFPSRYAWNRSSDQDVRAMIWWKPLSALKCRKLMTTVKCNWIKRHSHYSLGQFFFSPKRLCALPVRKPAYGNLNLYWSNRRHAIAEVTKNRENDLNVRQGG